MSVKKLEKKEHLLFFFREFTSYRVYYSVKDELRVTTYMYATDYVVFPSKVCTTAHHTCVVHTHSRYIKLEKKMSVTLSNDIIPPDSLYIRYIHISYIYIRVELKV